MSQGIEHIELLGNAEENFYALGLKDTDGFDMLFQSLKKLCMRTDLFSKAVKLTFDITNKVDFQKKEQNHSLIEAYAEGLKRPTSDVYFALLLPEFIAAFNKWTPNLLGLVPGCSSLFTLDKKTQFTVHARLLDYPLAGTFDNFERTALYHLKNRYKIFSLGTKGLCFPSLSAINEKGLTLALHYKHGDYFDLKGHSIFSTAFEILSFCESIHDVKKYLKEYPSMSYWGLYLSDATGLVGSFDICGREIYQEKFEMKEHNYLYFNNRPILSENKNRELQPYGNKIQCQMRREVFNDKWQKKKSITNKTLEPLKVLTTPLDQKKRKPKDLRLDTLTPSTIQAVSFNFHQDEVYIIGGKAPKAYNQEIYKYQNIFNQLKVTPVKTPADDLSNEWAPLREISLAQSYFDVGDIQKCYHHLQIGILKFKDHPLKNIYQFYFYVIEFMFENEKKSLSYTYAQMRELRGKLPEYLEDHLYLFLMRMEKILGIKEIDKNPPIKHPELREIYQKEYKLKAIAIKMMKKLIYPRMETFDIIYPL